MNQHQLTEASLPRPKELKHVLFHHCDTFNESLKKHIHSPGIEDALSAFISHKEKNPLEPFGSKDYAMKKEGPFGKAVSGLMHAGLNSDKSIFYTMHGTGDTRHVKLYGIYGHTEAGISNTPNIKIQKSLAKRLSNQEFEKNE